MYDACLLLCPGKKTKKASESTNEAQASRQNVILWIFGMFLPSNSRPQDYYIVGNPHKALMPHFLDGG